MQNLPQSGISTAANAKKALRMFLKEASKALTGNCTSTLESNPLETSLTLCIDGKLILFSVQDMKGGAV